MTQEEDRFDRLLREAGQDYHRPPDTPREALWRRVITIRPWLRWGLGVAALLALGIGIGRWTAIGPRATGPVAALPALAEPSEGAALAYRVAAAQYLTRTEALLTGFRSEASAGAP